MRGNTWKSSEDFWEFFLGDTILKAFFFFVFFFFCNVCSRTLAHMLKIQSFHIQRMGNKKRKQGNQEARKFDFDLILAE